MGTIRRAVCLRLFHPDAPRRDLRPGESISIGTTVTVPANGSRAHVALTPLAILRIRRLLEQESSTWSMFMSR